MTTTMLEIPADRYPSLRTLLPDTPWTTTPLHTVERRTGTVFADSLTSPSVIAVRTAPDVEGGAPPQVWVFGDPASSAFAGFALSCERPTEFICGEEGGRHLAESLPGATWVDASVVWFRRPTAPAASESPAEGVRRLRVADADSVSALGIAGALRTFESMQELVMIGGAYGAFEDGALVSAALTTSVSIGHACVTAFTVPSHRRRGYATAAVKRLVSAHHGQGRRVSAFVPGRDAAGELAARRVGFDRAARLRSWFTA